MSAANTILTLRGVTKRFRGLTAVSEIDLDLPAGSICSLIGPNGAGKSTLFNLVTGYLPPSAGTIEFAGTRIDGMPTDRISRMGIARAFQISKPFPSLSVFDNVRVGALFGAEGPRDPDAVVREVVTLTGLEAHAQAMASSLTVGFLRRLELARAIATRPRVLLADEPFAGLNRSETAEIVGILRDMRLRGLTILLVEHDMRAVMEISDHIFVIEAGRKIAEGSPAEIVRNARVIAAYLGTDEDDTSEMPRNASRT